jgi:hypothetical protein
MYSNFDDETFKEAFIDLPRLSDTAVKAICNIICDELASDTNPIYWRVVADDYKLRTGTEQY